MNLKHKTIKEIAEEIHKNSVNKGWWPEGQERNIPEMIALIHSELSEAMEAYRIGDKENFAEESADVAIRLMDMCEGLGIDLEQEIIRKHEINLKRPWRHGGKNC